MRTPTPWRLGTKQEDGAVAIHAKSASVFELVPFTSSYKDREASAALIIQAVNAHERLIRHLERLVSAVDSYAMEQPQTLRNTVDEVRALLTELDHA